MTLKTIFHKPVDRPIEGVIKANDEASLRLEIEEYVLTNEVEKRLESFLDAYNNYEGANGVWVSGFFGSGKSHLLKMLALLLENRQIDGVTALELFLPKCGENEILRGDLNRAIKIPSKSILFNIDQKADVISKTQIDALLAVFVKVFDETCGYYGKQGHIAQFERDLDSRGLYEPFKTAYQTLAGKSWHKGREQALLEGKNIAKAYADVTSGDESAALGILDKYRSQYRVSIEDFAEQVSAYIERQPAEFRLNFFVDEVGQYVADNVKLMTNLQTVAESLATKCRGRAWVIVTAQEDMASVVGEMGKQQSNDFSKIQARFANRMKLTSADVAEVIQKRLLMKNEQGVQLLGDIYHAQANNFKTLFDFADGSQTYRNFQDRDHFIHGYPFIPYQFALFQSAIQNLSQHNAFEGKHSSVGERSMLGVFQQVAIQIGDHQIGQLATFDLMFEGIRTALKANTQRAVISAEKQLDNTLAIRLLKALFLVKYVKAFKPTLRNLCVLMLEAFNQDLPGLRKKVEEALNLLEQQTYIQRNGELYEYLTDEEKDIEVEIKNTEVESNDVAAELEKLVFDYVIKNKKIRYDDNGQDYPFTRKLDERLFGRESELCIHIISPFHEFADNQASLVMHSFGRDELLAVMPPDDRLVRDILMYKRTEKYIRQNISITQQEAIKRILTDKSFQNRERYDALQKLVQTLLCKSKLYVAGNEIEIGTEDAQSRLIKGFHELITRTYTNLRMLRDITYTENDIAQCLKASQDGIFGNDVAALAESEQELLAFIQSNNRKGVRTTAKSLLEEFERKPYGWYFAAVLCTLASLCARGKVEMRLDGNLLAENELERALRNTHGHGNLVLEPQVEFTASQIRVLKAFYEDFFDTPPRASEAKALGSETAEAFQQLSQQLSRLTALASQYPFLGALNPVLDKLKELNGKPYIWYLTELARQEDSLLTMKEGVIDPVRKFMGTDDKPGEQRKIYDSARKFLQTQEPNFAYVESEVPTSIHSVLNDPTCFKGNRIQQIKNELDALAQKIDNQVEEVRTQAIERHKTLQHRMHGLEEFQKLPDVRMAELDAPYQELIEHIKQQSLIAVINDRLRYFEDQGYQKLLDKILALVAPKPSIETGDFDVPELGNNSLAKETRPQSVLSRNINIAFDKAWLVNENDVDTYLEAMREALLEEIRKGKRIQI
jgi:hypothetical protein